VRVAVVLTAFALIFPAELPDKSALASLVLATRYRALPVWLGAAAAFAVQCLIAVTAGSLLALLPHRLVAGLAALLFATGAVLAVRHHEAAADVGATTVTTSPARMAAASFGVLFLAEWGDFTQFTSAALTSRYDAPVEVFLGAWLALVTVSALAVVLGRGLLRVVPLHAVRLVAAAVFATVAVLSAVEALR
jgi:putative Ca2+/H+ antiporter (TMEM165/GDT1 family)